MNDSIDKYLNKSKNNLNTIVMCLENNIEFLENNLWTSHEEFKDIIQKIIDIYYDKYFMYESNDFNKISKYITFNNRINRKLKTILMSIIGYYESLGLNNIIKEKEASILYLNILIYVGIILYENNIRNIDTPKKIEKVINNIIDNFAKIRFKRDKDLFKLIDDIKDIVIVNNKFNDYINSLSNDFSKNSYIKINDDSNLYKVVYEFNIKELDNYEDRDIDIVNKKIKLDSVLTSISYDLVYYTCYKLLKNGLNYNVLFPINKNSLLDDSVRRFIIDRNNKVNNHIKLLVDYNEVAGDYEFINLVKEKNIDLYIEIREPIETNNYNMFMDMYNIIVPEEFLGINEKYIEIWKDMNMNFIIKNMGNKINEKDFVLGR